MPSKNWVEIRTGMGGQPILVEDRSALAVLEGFRFHPRPIAVIGSQSKRKLFDDNNTGAASSVASVRGVRILPWSKSQLLLDCELHAAANLATIKVLPPTGSRRERSLRSLIPPTPSKQALVDLSFNFYWQVILPFTPVVLLFLDDISDRELAVELLARWVKNSITSPILSPPRLILVQNNYDTYKNKFLAQLHMRLAAVLSPQDGSRAGLDVDTKPQCDTAFESIELLPAAAITPDFINSCVEEAFSYRERAGFAFSAVHLGNLLETAVDHFCDGQGKQLDLYHATRHATPSYKQLQTHITRFLELSHGLAIDQEEVIASSLDFDAHPPRMHYFQPSHEFDRLYLKTIASLATHSNSLRFITQIRRRYTELALERQAGSSARAHVNLLAQFKASWRLCYSHETCLVCLAQYPANPLSCGHTLCEPCVLVCGVASPAGSWDIAVELCPLCETLNKNIFSLRPPTAGIRVLDIEGSIRNKLAMWQFLRDLHYYTGLPGSIRQYFDLALGSGIGSFFVLTLFSEAWDLSDCKYHLKGLVGPVVRGKSSLVSFGKGLDWNIFESIRSKMGFVRLEINGQTYSNFTPQQTETPMEEIERYSDVYIRSPIEGFSVGFMRETAGRLISCLFYIELLSAPTFYSTPTYAQVLLQCRLSSGKPLLTLIKCLHRQRTLVHYRGDEAKPTSEPLVTSASLSKCRDGKLFSKVLKMRVDGFHTILNVKIDGIANGKENISNCPYHLNKLIKDQGLHRQFGSKDHRMSNESFDPNHEVTDDIHKLRDTLDRVILSYSDLTEAIYSPHGAHPALGTTYSFSTADGASVAINSFSNWV